MSLIGHALVGKQAAEVGCSDAGKKLKGLVVMAKTRERIVYKRKLDKDYRFIFVDTAAEFQLFFLATTAQGIVGNTYDLCFCYVSEVIIIFICIYIGCDRGSLCNFLRLFLIDRELLQYQCRINHWAYRGPALCSTYITCRVFEHFTSIA